MVITDYLIETHSFFEYPLQKLCLYDDIDIYYRYIPNKRIICYQIGFNCKKSVKNSCFFFLRFHIFKSGFSYFSWPVITKCGFLWFQKLTTVFIFHIRHILVLYHTYFRFSAYLADPTPKNRQTCVYISFISGIFQSLCNIVALYIKLLSLTRR